MCSCAGWWRRWPASFFFFFNDTATTEIYPLSLHDALPISNSALGGPLRPFSRSTLTAITLSPLRYTSSRPPRDRKSTRLNSSHGYISYAVFCLKKKKHLQNLLKLPYHNTHLTPTDPPDD